MKSQIIQIITMIGITSALFIGCASYPTSQSSSKPNSIPGRMVEEPKPNTLFDHVRMANEKQIQDFTRGKSVSYSKIHGNLGILSYLSKDEKEIVLLEGPPNYIRHFNNHRGLAVDEWLYENKDYQLQFKEGKLVYCDSIDEQAKIVLEYGQPTWVKTQLMAGGQQKELFWYQSWWRFFTFSNGKLIITQ